MAEASKFRGADKTLAQLKQIQFKAPNIFAAALYKESEIEAKECKRQCPVDTGALRASIHVEGPVRSADRKISTTIVAGGPSEPYALIVHENLEAFHKVGNAKYIERPLNESAPYLPARVAARIDLNEAL